MNYSQFHITKTTYIFERPRFNSLRISIFLLKLYCRCFNRSLFMDVFFGQSFLGAFILWLNIYTFTYRYCTETFQPTPMVVRKKRKSHIVKIHRRKHVNSIKQLNWLSCLLRHFANAFMWNAIKRTHKHSALKKPCILWTQIAVQYIWNQGIACFVVSLWLFPRYNSSVVRKPTKT